MSFNIIDEEYCFGIQGSSEFFVHSFEIEVDVSKIKSAIFISLCNYSFVKVKGDFNEDDATFNLITYYYDDNKKLVGVKEDLYKYSPKEIQCRYFNSVNIRKIKQAPLFKLKTYNFECGDINLKQAFDVLINKGYSNIKINASSDEMDFQDCHKILSNSLYEYNKDGYFYVYYSDGNLGFNKYEITDLNNLDITIPVLDIHCERTHELTEYYNKKKAVNERRSEPYH
jgi:hypothetical protein